MTRPPESTNPAAAKSATALPASWQGRKILLEAEVAYPGSRVSDVLVAGHKVQIPNGQLRAAHRSLRAILGAWFTKIVDGALWGFGVFTALMIMHAVGWLR